MYSNCTAYLFDSTVVLRDVTGEEAGVSGRGMIKADPHDGIQHHE